ncbi:MAG: 1-(5-phosphoribosyl)-5-[(5-phosphoribosylamino)methylideneamino] imidazole-4-carboxamide isomerase [Methanomassiliicoccales archaeon]|jgi:phosphoribosylformimino-5-aminoimidazole carboxamide ribotide isomerase|nr:1-(5-phosphoribosyl)-5-[(5-phosphoribosylamino)methylideneamino] imidazole-4-carboxamide isomerase [Methanomassiliicoccales archaeon]
MMVLPAVDILDGKVVQLVGGKPGTEQIVLPDPLEVALDWERKGAPMVHVVDLDGAFGRGGNPHLIRRMLESLRIPMQVGGGVRSSAIVEQYVAWGAARVIVGTKAITDTNWLREVATQHPGRIVLALDVAKGQIQVKGWQESARLGLEQMFELIRPLPLAAVLHTDVDVEGRAQGINATEVRRFVERCPHKVIASGGIKGLEDVRALESLGAEAAVAGIALYTKRINPADIWRRGR